jgi:hypothetical protein
MKKLIRKIVEFQEYYYLGNYVQRLLRALLGESGQGWGLTPSLLRGENGFPARRARNNPNSANRGRNCLGLKVAREAVLRP